jgi:hypothetical protein
MPSIRSTPQIAQSRWSGASGMSGLIVDFIFLTLRPSGDCATVSLCGLIGQHAMDKRNGNGAFSDRGRHAFYIAAPDVADSEHARTRRFKKIR